MQVKGQRALSTCCTSKAQTQLGWQLTVFFKEMINMRVNADLKRLS
jgi:GDP-D-mannose dehydratase